jgi:glutathione S-transferase
MPNITLYFLQASRSIRIAWLLEELGLPYEVKAWERDGNAAPLEFKEQCGHPLGKAPTLRDGDMTIYESGAIAEYALPLYSLSPNY